MVNKKVFYCSVDNEWEGLYCDNGISKSENITELFGDHLEADTQFFFHTKHAGVLALELLSELMALLFLFSIENNVWYYFGLDSANSLTCIDITDLSKQIEYLQALSGIYTLVYIPERMTGINCI